MIGLCKLSKRGMTMIEVTVALAITTIMVTCTMGMLLATARRGETQMTQGSTDTDASLALQMMVGDIREAKQVTIQASGAQLLINYPVRVSATQGAYYDRSTLDAVHTITYYQSDTSHVIGRAGNCLWRWRVKPDGTNEYRCIRNDVDTGGLLFETDVPKSIQITIKTKSAVSHYAMKKGVNTSGIYTQLQDRVVYLRNY